MRHLLIAGAIAAAIAAPAAASDQTDVVGVVTHFFTDPDLAAATKLCAADAVVIDDFAPHVWHGPDACAHWLKDYTAWSKAQGVTPGPLTLGKARHAQVDGATAYVVAPAKYTFEQKGKTIVHSATVTAALRKTGGKWLITGWAWGND
jgi:ketosteroid isomerase-like protein